MSIFRPGDRVRPTRRKRGPVMVVKGYDEDANVICSWYAARAGWTLEVFAEKRLRRVRRLRAAGAVPSA
jgi:uncharacterized protein YodC (DUF2158 family)